MTDRGQEPSFDSPPRLTVGLPTYNGERFIRESIESLLAQSFRDFELVISDNGSTDATGSICERYSRLDPRVRLFRQDKNLGSAANHNFVIEQARGEFFKWAADDDVYGRDLLVRCVQLLDANPDAVVAHSFDALIDEQGTVVSQPPYTLETDSTSAVRRFHSLLYGRGGNDIYGVVRTGTIRRTQMHGSYHNADRTLVAELALHGRFVQWPEVLFYRRDHPDRAERVAGRAAEDRPARGKRPSLVAIRAYLKGYADGINASPLSARQKLACYVELAGFGFSRMVPLYKFRMLASYDPAIRERAMESRIVRCQLWFTRRRNDAFPRRRGAASPDFLETIGDSSHGR